MNQEPKSEESELKRSPRRRSGWFGRLAGIVLKISLVLLLLMIGLLWYTYKSTQTVPDFYKTVLDQDQNLLDQGGDKFESNLLELQNSSRRSGEWQIAFSQDEINGWLAADMPKKFPDSLPAFIADPRVSITDGEMKIACRFDTKKLKGIVVATADVFSTDTPNQVAVRIKSVKSGIVPLPVAKYADKLSEGLRYSNVPIEWSEIDGDPVALITLPEETMQLDNQQVFLQTLQLVDGKMVVGGVSEGLSDFDSDSPDE